MSAELAGRFYESFARKDAGAMAAFYHPDATFEDPAFGPLDREGACAMWAMLLGRSADLTVTHRLLHASDTSAEIAWEARYTFTRTGRPVLNRIKASLTFRDGLILTHRDRFPFWAWACQAFGLGGWLLGWTPWFRRRVRAEALRALASSRPKSPPPA